MPLAATSVHTKTSMRVEWNCSMTRFLWFCESPPWIASARSFCLDSCLAILSVYRCVLQKTMISPDFSVCSKWTRRENLCV